LELLERNDLRHDSEDVSFDEEDVNPFASARSHASSEESFPNINIEGSMELSKIPYKG